MTEKEGFLFDPFNHQLVEPSKPKEPPAEGAPEEDKPRLRGQNAAILKRLQEGRATNVELSEIALKYTSRISDVRKWLKKWEPEKTIEKSSLGGGVFIYWLQSEGVK